NIAGAGAAESVPGGLGAGDLATIAATDALRLRSAGASVGETIAATGDQPHGGGAVPVLAASSAFGRYQIVRLPAGAAMAAVYLPSDTQLPRHVALKTPSLGNSRTVIDRFLREARSAAQLRSPYLCPLYDVGQIGGVYYLSMAFIDGQPL